MIAIGQQRMFKPEPRLPALGQKDYVALLKWQPGERRALREASPEVRSRLFPMIEVTTRRAREREALMRTALPTLAEKMAMDVGDETPVWLDLAKIGAQHHVVVQGVQYPAVPYVYESMREHRVTAIPVIRLGEPSTPLRLLADIVKDDGYGVCIRVRPRTTQLPSGVTYADLIHTVTSTLGIGADQSDLLLDFEWISEDTIIQPEEAADILDEFLNIGVWRNVIVAGTSMPASLGVIPAESLGTIRRREWDLWRALTNLKLGIPVVFGDYGIQHSEAPANGSALHMKANIRYTLEDSTLVARGRAIREAGVEQYRQLCQAIIHHRYYQDPGFSWGDAELEKFAAGRLEPRGGAVWRAIGTSHHLQVVANQLNAA